MISYKSLDKHFSKNIDNQNNDFIRFFIKECQSYLINFQVNNINCTNEIYYHGINLRLEDINNTVLPIFDIYYENKLNDLNDREYILKEINKIKYSASTLIKSLNISKLNFSINIDPYGKISSKNKKINDKINEDSFIKILTYALNPNYKYKTLYFHIEPIGLDVRGNTIANTLIITSTKDITNYFIKKYKQYTTLAFYLKSFYISFLQNNIKQESIKSAKAAIMSRNMSHNLGSHVMAYLKQHLNSVQDIISANILSQLFLDSENIESIIKDPNVWLQRLKNLCEIEDNGKQLKEIALPFLVGLGRFISYLQERQDFIATIATDYIPYYSGVNFKDFIYDELNPDLRFERHRERAGLQPDNILLGNIARSEGLGRTTSPTLDKSSALHDIVLYFRDFDGHQIVANAPGSTSPKSSLDAMRQYVFSLPGGVVGRQALFSILENVIRNAAKHGDWRNSPEKRLEIKFDIYCKTDFDRLDKSPDIFSEEEKKCLKAFLPVYRTYYEQAQGIEDLYIITLTDNLSVSGKALMKLRKAITEPYVRDSGEMINANKGIKEMRISASWLRSLEDDTEDHPYTITPKEGTEWSQETPWTGKAPVLLADIVKEKETKPEGALRYIFCVMRQKKIALITERKSTIIQRYRKQLLQNSWDVYTFKEYKQPATNKSYEFIIMDVYRQDGTGKEANYIQKEYDELRRISPNRLYKSDVLEGRDIIGMLLQDTEQDFKYFDHILKDLYRKIADAGKEDIISISDDKTSKKYQQEPYPNKLVEIGDGDCKINKYLYKKHFEAKSEFDSFMKLQPAQCLFVEGITGNNSTDRLIRNEPIDELWTYRHLHTIKSKVAVFDERLFSKIFKVDESDIHAYRSPVSLPQIEDCPEGDDAEEYFISCSLNIGQKIDEYLKNNPQQEQIFGEISDIRQLRDYIYSHESWFSNSLNKILKADYRSIAYNMKGIDAFTILKTGKGIFEIYGYCGYIQEDEYFGRCEKIGSIHFENGKFVVQNEMKDFMGQSKNPMKYDYLTIHQGLLDKIYEEFGIKDNAQSKHAFSQAFYAAFSATPEDIIDYEDRLQDGEEEEVFTGFFLPRLFIHSGRSKPAPRDMPQKQPFIQYAAIEHAVLDCKYSLIELLDSARYE